MYIPNDIKILSKIEQNHDVLSIFQYKDTTAWISIKNLITTSLYDDDIRINNSNKNNIFSLKGIKTILNSLKYYLFLIFDKKEKDIFLGASTGLFAHKNQTKDAYFPYDSVDHKSTIYMLNCTSLDELIKYDKYIKKYHIVIENYLLVIVKKLFTKLFSLILSKKKKLEIRNFNTILKIENINISDKHLIRRYMEFSIGYRLYQVFFRLLNIKTAYIVSAPTKSDMLAALKSLNIKTIEIQHGIVGRLHRGYNFTLSKNNILPTVDKINVYNQFWKDEIIKAGYFKEEQINIVGRLKYDIVEKNIEKLNFKYIVFTGQGAFFNQIIKFFKDADKLLSENKIKMFYKAHPREFKSEKDAFKKSINDLKSCNFYEDIYTTEELIKNSIAHISVFSSCHFDAVYYKEKTYILDIMENNIMNFYVNSAADKFIKINTIKDLIKNETFN
jgi:hypothetical protein